MALVTLFVRMKEENQRVGEKLSLNGYATTVDTPEEQVAYSPTFGALSVANAYIFIFKRKILLNFFVIIVSLVVLFV
jgi:hypothetical protein